MEGITEVLEQRAETRRNRRSALLMGGAALAGLALTRGAQAQAAAAITDADILNFALNLEFLEAQFYTLATTGMTIDKLSTPISTASGDGATAGGTVSVKASAMVNFTDAGVKAYAMETAMEEQNHVKFLQSALNANSANAAVAMPNIDLMASFNTLATAAGLTGGFDPFSDDLHFLLGAFIFEDVGVSAYLGAAPLIQSSAYLSAALGIHAVEAYHAGNIRTQLFQMGANSSAATISQAIAMTRGTLSGSGYPTGTYPNSSDIGVGVVPVSNGGLSGMASTIVDVDPAAGDASPLTPGRVQPRTTTQVLGVVYGGDATTPGVFFPNGLNGTIK